MVGLKIFFSVVLLLLYSGGCRLNNPRGNAQNDSKTNISPDSNSTINQTPPIFSDSPEWRKIAWQQFTADGHYRIAQSQDFNFPVAAMQDEHRRNQINHLMNAPYITGDANRDSRHGDMSVIVINTYKEDSARFGIVIFNEPSNKQETVYPIWLYKDVDLSKSILSKWSGGIGLITYLENGTPNFCYVNWNVKQKIYSCDESPQH
jgi:hypothetical protein